MAISVGLDNGIALGLKNIHIFTDCTDAIHAVNSPNDFLGPEHVTLNLIQNQFLDGERYLVYAPA